jgi:hypothetical protein
MRRKKYRKDKEKKMELAVGRLKEQREERRRYME